MPRRVTIGPLALPTLMGDLKETLGDQLETVGAGVVPGERRPRPFPLSIPIHGDVTDGTDRFKMGNRLRRQVRALMENSQARLEGLYLAFSPDPELNGWLLVGGGELAYANGGISLADYKLELTDCYKVANLRTHRPARRLVVIDRRLATTARDYLGTLYGAGFAASTAVARHYLPVGVTDVALGSTRYSPILSTLVTADGSLSFADGLTDGDIIDFSQSEADMPRAGVRILDRQRSVVEANWEQVYGPDQPLTAAGIPVIENAVCRCQFTGVAMDVQSWTGSAWSTDATVTLPAGISSVSTAVVEWTPERAVLTLTGAATAGRAQIFVTLQRGWSGPRVECYIDNISGTAVASLSVFAKSVGDATLQRSDGTFAITTGTNLGAFTGLQPWALLLGPGTDRAVHVSVVSEMVVLAGAALSGREGVTASGSAAPSPPDSGRYVSLWIGLGPRATGAADATAHGQRGLTDARAVPELVAR